TEAAGDRPRRVWVMGNSMRRDLRIKAVPRRARSVRGRLSSSGVARFVRANGIDLHVVEWGRSRAPHVLLVHGWDGTARYWDLVAPAFAERYPLVAVTLRGRGRSAVDPTGRYRFDDYVSDLDQVTRQLGFERFLFVGASLGGMLALPYTAQYPKRVERL